MKLDKGKKMMSLGPPHAVPTLSVKMCQFLEVLYIYHERFSFVLKIDASRSNELQETQQ